jgi:hypothetical protein
MISRDAASLGEYGQSVEGAVAELRDERVVERMWEGDHTVWGPEPDEIANRLGWLRSPEETEKALPDIRGLAEAEAMPGVLVFQAGTREEGGRLLANGGRVLNVTALGSSPAEARERAYEAADRIEFDGKQLRRDIAARAVERVEA